MSHGVLPFSTKQGSRTKGILAMGMAATNMIFSISRLIYTVHEKPVYVFFHAPVEIRDTDGNVVRDAQGKPCVKLVKRFEILEPNSAKYDKTLELSFGLDKGIVVKFSAQKNGE